ncbi:unnamed protein product, partial [Urochloa humidicola]
LPHTTAPGRLNCSPAPSLASSRGGGARPSVAILASATVILAFTFPSTLAANARPSVARPVQVPAAAGLGLAVADPDPWPPASTSSSSTPQHLPWLVPPLLFLSHRVVSRAHAASPSSADLDLGSGSFGDYSVHRVFLDPGGKHCITTVVHPGSELLLQIDPRASSIDPQRRHRAGGLRR